MNIKTEVENILGYETSEIELINAYEMAKYKLRIKNQKVSERYLYKLTSEIYEQNHLMNQVNYIAFKKSFKEVISI